MNRTAVLLLIAGLVMGAVVTPAVLRLPGSGATAEPQSSSVYRWLNTEVTIPEAQRGLVRVVRDAPPVPEGPFTIEVFKQDDDEYRLRIDAASGRVLADGLSERDPQLAQAVVDSIKLTTAPPSEWPYTDNEPPARLSWGQIDLPVPAPAAGIVLATTLAYCNRPGCADEFVQATTGRMTINIDASSGSMMGEPQPIEGQPFDATDAAALTRLAAAAKVVRGPIEEPTPEIETPTPGPTPTAITDISAAAAAE